MTIKFVIRKVYLDIDECIDSEVTGVCPQNSLCNNTNGSFTCDCQEGYQELQNGTCNGKSFIVVDSREYLIKVLFI